jgi:murein L,D-transpeptidase YcbB/YkuD
MRKLISMAAIVAVMTGVTLAMTTGPASAALSSCNSTVIKLSSQADNTGERFRASIPARSGSVSCLLSRGNAGSAVKSLQRTLNRCFSAGLAVDGAFGPATEAALKNAQGVVGTTKDGVYGPNTRDRFNAKKKWRLHSIITTQTACGSVNF